MESALEKLVESNEIQSENPDLKYNSLEAKKTKVFPIMQFVVRSLKLLNSISTKLVRIDSIKEIHLPEHIQTMFFPARHEIKGNLEPSCLLIEFEDQRKTRLEFDSLLFSNLQVEGKKFELEEGSLVYLCYFKNGLQDVPFGISFQACDAIDMQFYLQHCRA